MNSSSDAGVAITLPELAWPRQAGPLTLRPPTPADLEQVLTWRNRPEVTRWLLRTVVDPEEFTRAWLEDRDDDVAVVALIDDQVVGSGSLGIVKRDVSSATTAHRRTTAKGVALDVSAIESQ